MDSKAQQIFSGLYESPDNKFCFECGQPSNQWASVNNGIFLCLSCSGLHRGFGVNVSFVRSVTMDTWSDLQLALMKHGGNLKLKKFFENYKMPKDAPMDFKYRTKAGLYYREMLKAKAEGRELPPLPSEVEGLELVSSANPATNIGGGTYGGFGSTPYEEKKSGFSFDSIKNTMTEVITEAGKVTKQVVQKVGDKVTDPEFKQQVKDVGSKIANQTKNVAETVVAKSKEIGKELPGIANQTANSLKKGFNSAVSFFKNKTGVGASNENAAPTTDSSYQEFFAAPNNNNSAGSDAYSKPKNTDSTLGTKQGSTSSGWNNDW